MLRDSANSRFAAGAEGPRCAQPPGFLLFSVFCTFWQHTTSIQLQKKTLSLQFAPDMSALEIPQEQFFPYDHGVLKKATAPMAGGDDVDAAPTAAYSWPPGAGLMAGLDLASSHVWLRNVLRLVGAIMIGLAVWDFSTCDEYSLGIRGAIADASCTLRRLRSLNPQ